LHCIAVVSGTLGSGVWDAATYNINNIAFRTTPHSVLAQSANRQYKAGRQAYAKRPYITRSGFPLQSLERQHFLYEPQLSGLGFPLQIARKQSFAV
jgi:hypothetical protein